MQYKYDDYDYYTEHEYDIKERQKVLEEILQEDFSLNNKKCA